MWQRQIENTWNGLVDIYTFMEIDRNIKKDSLSDFIGEMTFIPHAFGYQCNDPEAVCGDRITGDFELICFVGGEGNITVDNVLYICHAGDAMLIPPFTVHKIQTPVSNPHENYFIHFDLYPFHLHKNFIAAMLGDTGNKLHPGLSAELLSLYRLLKNELESEKPGRMHFVSTVLSQIIIELLRHKKSPPADSVTAVPRSPEAEIVRRSLDFIQNNLSSKIGPADIAGCLHISESYLFKCFSVIMQMPPNQFIQLAKIKKAELLLKSTQHTIKEISDMLAFSSPFYFSNVYKKYYRVSPREYMHALNTPGL